jgi:glyoxylase-like metal-dependent hydrolase (beta-lactamase superfamily II)
MALTINFSRAWLHGTVYLRLMNRRDFFVRSSVLLSASLFPRLRLFGRTPVPAAGGSAAPAPSRAKSPAPPFTAFHPLRGGVGYFTGRGGTIGWLSTGEVLAVVDTQFPDTASICLAGLPDRRGRPVDVVLNTHHHADHTSGNPVFKAAARTIVAQARVPNLQFAAAEKAGTLDAQVYADTTFTEVWRHDFGGEIVTAQYFGPAHTSGDAVVHFERANVVHMGDLVFNRLYPVIDRPAGGSVRGWIARLEEVLKSYPADAIYLFGHGRAAFGVRGGPDDLRTMRDYFSAVLDFVQKGIAAHRTKEQIVAVENLPGFQDFHQPRPNRLAQSLAAAYDELTGKG